MNKPALELTRLSIISLYLILFPFIVQAQFCLHYNMSETALFEPSTTASKAYYYESTSEVEDQKGEWNFELKKPIETRIISFNKKGQYDNMIFFLSDNRFMILSEFQYDSNDLLTEVDEEVSNRNTKFTLKYSYDSNTVSPTSMSIFFREKEIKQHIWTKDLAGRVIETIYQDEKILKKIIRQKKLIQSVEYHDTITNNITQKTFEYDQKNKLIRTSIYLANDHLKRQSSYRYQLNKRGDWIKRLEHREEIGKYFLTTREIIYEQDIADLQNNTPVGLWQSPLSKLAIILEKDGVLSLMDLKEDELISGTWHDNGWGQLQLNLNKNNHLGFSSRWRNSRSFTAEIIEGRLKIYADGDKYFELVNESIIPPPPALHEFINYKHWENSIWLKPGFRDPEAIPEALRTTYTSIYPVAPNKFSASKEDGTSTIVNEKGIPMIPFIYENVSYIQNNHFIVSLEGKKGLLDSVGQIILPFEYDRIWPEPVFGYKIFGTRKNGKRYYYDVDKAAFWPYEKEDMIRFNDDRWVVKSKHYWLLTDKDFKPITPDSTYRLIRILTPNRYLAAGRGQFWIIDQNGNDIASLGSYKDIRKAQYGYLLGKKENDLYALIDYDGNELTEAIYENITFCKDEKYQQDLCDKLTRKGLIAKFKKPAGREGYLNGFGEEVIE